MIPITGPELTVDYLRIEPVSVPLSDAGRAFCGVLNGELTTALDEFDQRASAPRHPLSGILMAAMSNHHFPPGRR